MMILLYFKFTRTLVFTICLTVTLNIADSSIRCLEKNTDVHQQIQTLIVKTDHLAFRLAAVLASDWAEQHKSFLAPIRSQNGGDR